MRTRVLLVDDHEMFLAGIEALLKLQKSAPGASAA